MVEETASNTEGKFYVIIDGDDLLLVRTSPPSVEKLGLGDIGAVASSMGVAGKGFEQLSEIALRLVQQHANDKLRQEIATQNKMFSHTSKLCLAGLDPVMVTVGRGRR